jgi:hypothetical protein
MNAVVSGFCIALAVGAAAVGAATGLGNAQANEGILGFLGDSCPAVGASAPSSRVMAWDGSDRAGIAVPGNVVYQPGSDDKVHISGDPRAVAAIRLRNGTIDMDCNMSLRDHQLRIVLPGRQFRSFHVSGSADLALRKLDQAALDVSVSGSGDVTADGKVEEQNIRVSGSGDVDFGRVTGRVATVKISGSGDAAIAPRDEADIRVSGSGDVTLRSNPAVVKQHVSGSGDVHRAS